MKMHSFGNVRRSAQAGFTLIELIVVIVILGILAATALPKFADLGGDARMATLKAARGSLESVSAMVHGKFLISGSGAVNMEGISVTQTNGYPAATIETMRAAGLTDTDYLVTASADGTNTPVVSSGEVIAIPRSVAGTTVGATCYVKYAAAAASAATPPVISPPLITLGTAC